MFSLDTNTSMHYEVTGCSSNGVALSDWSISLIHAIVANAGWGYGHILDRDSIREMN